MGSKRITEEQRQQMAYLALAGLKQCEIGRKLGISKSSVSSHLQKMTTSEIRLQEGVTLDSLMAKKEPAADTSASEQNLQANNNTKQAESQALRGTDLLGVLQTMLENAYGRESKITFLQADEDTASISFTYGGEGYTLLFGRE